jgi:AraC-like DNA-binding protein
MSAEEQFMQRLQNQIEKHLSDSELSIEMLSEELGISRTQLFRKTKAFTGVSPIELIRHVRLRKAQQLLRKTDSTIQQVAYEVGFSSPSYFTKCYKEFFGTNPSSEHSEKKDN